MPVPDTSDNGIGGCFVSFRGRPLPPEFLCLDPGGLLGDFWVELLGPGLAGGLTDDDVLDDDVLLGGLDCDFENDGDENPCFAETKLHNIKLWCEKIDLWDFWPGPTQINLCSHRNSLDVEIRDLSRGGPVLLFFPSFFSFVFLIFLLNRASHVLCSHCVPFVQVIY